MVTHQRAFTFWPGLTLPQRMVEAKQNFSQNLSALFRDNILFFQEFLREFKSTGTFCPTGRYAAACMITPLMSRTTRRPLRILELGPGTGSVTLPILNNMQPGDDLTICEINPRFLEVLKTRLSNHPAYSARKEHVRFFGCAVQQLPVEEKFDVIVCAIPFLNLELAGVEEIFAKLRGLSHSETVMTYYEYIGLRQIGMVLSPPQRRTRLRQINSFFLEVFKSHLVRKFSVYLNVLPINIYMLKGLNALPVSASLSASLSASFLPS